jgi:hypothetical protein
VETSSPTVDVVCRRSLHRCVEVMHTDRHHHVAPADFKDVVRPP